MLKDILKEFDEKFDDYWWATFNVERNKQIKQFLSDKLKQAMDSVKLEHKTFPEKESDEFDAGYNFAVDQMNNNIKEFYETKN